MVSRSHGEARPDAPAAQLPPVERHPFEPFLPAGARLLMLGSFPPQEKRWAMRFYYPNLQNDMWRIMGLIFFGNPARFLTPDGKGYRETELKAFLIRTGIALYDTAAAVRRLSGNASDKNLLITEPADIEALLLPMPLCRHIITTGQKATETLCQTCGISQVPRPGASVPFRAAGRDMTLHRLPSSSRAYPLSLRRKAEAYEAVFREIGLKTASPR